jgi:hypothetical protein
VNDAERVGYGEPTADLQSDADRSLVRKRSPCEPRFETLAVEVLHHDVRRAVAGHVDVVDVHHMFADDRRRGARLASKALDRPRITQRLVDEQLDGDPLVQSLVTCGEDHPHASAPQHALDAVLASENLTFARNAG